MLKNINKKVHLTGNIGRPLSGFINDIKSGDVIVIEISVQQLCNFKDFKCNTAVLLNLYGAHLDFVKDITEYRNIKLRIFANQTSSDFAVLNYDDEHIRSLTENLMPIKEYFSANDKKECCIIDESIYYKNEFIIKLSDILIKGNHNYENIMASIITAKKYGVSNEMICKVLTTFKGVEHRIEYVTTLNDIAFYNDSKSTNTVATITALKSFTSPVILILGGLERNHDFNELIPFMKDVKEIICYGECKNRIADFCNKNNVKVNVLETLEEAVMLAYKNASMYDTILLSPASASWDQFKDFEERGNHFKEIIEKLKES